MTKSAVIIEDERDVSDLVRHALARDGFAVRQYFDGNLGLAGVDREPPDVLILDLMLPGIEGLEICRRLRANPKTAHVPILMLTARAEDIDQVAGLEVGADDYITKPFSPRVLMARVKSVLRRGTHDAQTGEVVRVGNIQIDSGRHEVRVEGEAVALTATEFKILKFLAGRPGRVRTRMEIVESVSGEIAVLERTVDAHVMSLRKKLGVAGDLVETVRGVGYKLREG
ncbi:MAG: response regulator transcription factor [Planctomycetes bacterium]|nr:response regulator transcription factor [Planctomycetota bacterium]